MRTNRPIIKNVVLYFPATLDFVALPTLIFLALGVNLGVLTTVHANRRWLTFPTKLPVGTGMGIPIFWLGVLGRVLFYSELEILPAAGCIAVSVAVPKHITGLYLLGSLKAGAFGILPAKNCCNAAAVSSFRGNT